MSIQKTPLPRKLLIFTVSAFFFATVFLWYHAQCWEHFIPKRKVWAFAKWRNSITVKPFDQFFENTVVNPPEEHLLESFKQSLLRHLLSVVSCCLSFVWAPTILCMVQEYVSSMQSDGSVSHVQPTYQQRILLPQHKLSCCLPHPVWARDEQSAWLKGWERVPARKG